MYKLLLDNGAFPLDTRMWVDVVGPIGFALLEQKETFWQFLLENKSMCQAIFNLIEQQLPPQTTRLWRFFCIRNQPK